MWLGAQESSELSAKTTYHFQFTGGDRRVKGTSYQRQVCDARSVTRAGSVGYDEVIPPMVGHTLRDVLSSLWEYPLTYRENCKRDMG